MSQKQSHSAHRRHVFRKNYAGNISFNTFFASCVYSQQALGFSREKLRADLG